MTHENEHLPLKEGDGANNIGGKPPSLGSAEITGMIARASQAVDAAERSFTGKHSPPADGSEIRHAPDNVRYSRG